MKVANPATRLLLFFGRGRKIGGQRWSFLCIAIIVLRMVRRLPVLQGSVPQAPLDGLGRAVSLTTAVALLSWAVLLWVVSGWGGWALAASYFVALGFGAWAALQAGVRVVSRLRAVQFVSLSALAAAAVVCLLAVAGGALGPGRVALAAFLGLAALGAAGVWCGLRVAARSGRIR